MTRIVLTFGLIAGVIMSGMFLVMLPFHDQMIEAGAIVGYASMIAAFLLIFFGIRRYRETVGGGAVSFGRAFQVGILIGLVASACYVATWEAIYFSGNAPGFLEKYQTAEIEKMRSAGKSAAEIAKQEEDFKVWAERYENPLINSAVTLMEPLPVALLMALVSAAVLRRRSPGSMP